MRQTKRLFLLLCMTLAITANAYANKKHAKEINCLANVENANGKEHKWEKIMDAIIQVESGGNPNAKGGNSLGILQITPIMVKECNDILKDKGLNKRYKLSDRLSTKKSHEMFILIMNKYNKKGTAKEACRIWNRGIYSKKVKDSYWKKFLKYYNKNKAQS